MKRFISILIALIMVFGTLKTAFATDITDIDAVISCTASYIRKTVKNPQVGSVGGEWAVLGLARSNETISEEYYQNYYKNVQEYVKKHNGVLHEKKYTEYSRVILALTAIGKNPADVSGYNLLIPLGDYEKTIWQGVNGSIWALIALDSGNYDIPKNPDAKIQATKEMYIDHILKNQTSDGGWALSGDVLDPDVTGMALQALSKYRNNENVRNAIEKTLSAISLKQNANGGFSSWETENSESCVQMIVALCELGISVDDARFLKNEKTMLDNLFSFYDGKNGFKHTHDGNTNQMATEQCFYALVSLKRLNEGKNSLYNMSDVVSVDDIIETEGLSGKNADVKKMKIKNYSKTFSDIQYHKDKAAIEALASREIINGKSENCFEPENTMTRAEFATIIARGLGLPQKSNGIFDDVTENDWFYSYVNTAYSYGIIKGVSEKEFNPNGTITREEAAVMVTRAASLCGMDTQMDVFATRDTLAQFFDYVKASNWSQSSLAFCYRKEILSNEVMEIKPKEAVKRAEIAYMLYNMLLCSNLL